MEAMEALGQAAGPVVVQLVLEFSANFHSGIRGFCTMDVLLILMNRMNVGVPQK